MKGPSPELAWSPQVRSDCVYMWERTVMGISVHTAETEMAKTPYYSTGAKCSAAIVLCETGCACHVSAPGLLAALPSSSPSPPSGSR